MGALDWTLLINTSIITLGTIANGLGVAWVIRQVRTPSGDTIGHVAERTHDLAAASVIHTTHLVEELNGDRINSGDGEALG